MGASETAAQTGMLAIDYPESDGKPLGETGYHVTATFDLFGRLRDR